jgi:hypothetical protein
VSIPRLHRILALDGGGIRGIISVEVLHRVESLLRAQTCDPDLRLGDWFDLIAGTSTGAITAALLCTGHTVDDIRRFYATEADALFDPAGLRERLRHRYDATRLRRRLQDTLGAETTLGSDRLRTLLMLVMRNATTDSPWIVSNIPTAKFNDRRLAGCNLDLPLWQLVRASSAAPTFFEPESITLGSQTFVFSDGALTGYNNPAFKAFLIATTEPYGLSWSVGRDRLLVVSVGTGTASLADATLAPEAMHLLYHAQAVPGALLSSMDHMQDLLCRVFGECLVGEPLDLEVGDLIGTRGPADPKLFTYLRYNVSLTAEGLTALGFGGLDPSRLSRLDDVSSLDTLRQVGARMAEQRVRRIHFDGFVQRGDGPR